MRLAVKALRAHARSSMGKGALQSAPPHAKLFCMNKAIYQCHLSTVPALWGPQHTLHRHFTTSLAIRQQAEPRLREESIIEEFQEASEEVEEEGAENEIRQQKKIPERDATFASLKPHMAYPTWKSLTVKPFGYVEMSDVQNKVLHLLPELADPLSPPMPDGQGRDMFVKARTGTGKTIAFLVPAIERRINAIYNAERGRLTEPFDKMLKEHKPDFNFESLDKHGRTALGRQFATNTVGTLVISPTRELATQIANEAVKLHYHHDKFGVQLLVGGASKMHQLNDWRRSRPDVVVATPGRLLDLAETEPMVREALSATQTLILDEADQLLEMGFREEIEKLMRFIPGKGERVTMLFSATVSKDIRQVARISLSNDARFIDCVPEGETNVHEHIPQTVTVMENSENLFAHITRLIALDQLQNAGKSKIIIFASTTKYTQFLADLLKDRLLKQNLPAGIKTNFYELHSKKEQSVRFRISDAFRKDESGASILITSDVSARGVDYPGCTRVIQVGAPKTQDQYIHRLGRTGRAGSEGKCDLVLLPFEAPFREVDLAKLPVRDISIEETERELKELAEKFDVDPTSVVDPEIWRRMQKSGDRDDFTARRKRGPPPSRSSSSSLIQLQIPIAPKLESIGETITASLDNLDQEEVHLIYGSMVGFYIGCPWLQGDKMAAVEGLKEWATGACRVARAPFISQRLAEQMGINMNSRGGGRGFSRGGSRGGYSRDSRDGGGFSRDSRGGSRDFGGDRRGGGRFGSERSGEDNYGGGRYGGSSYGGSSYGGGRGSREDGGGRGGFGGDRRGDRGDDFRGSRGGFGGSRGGGSSRGSFRRFDGGDRHTSSRGASQIEFS